MEEKEMIERIVANEQRSKSNTKRLDSLEQKVEDTHELTYSIKEIATEVRLMREDVNKIDSRVESLEKEPGQNYIEAKKAIRNSIVATIVGAIVGGLIALILK